MISWILAGILIVIALILLKFKEIRHRAGLFVLIFILLFFVITASQVYSTYKIDLKSFDGVAYAGKVYLAWLGNLFHNVKSISGYAIKQDWSFNLSNVSQIKK